MYSQPICTWFRVCTQLHNLNEVTQITKFVQTLWHDGRPRKEREIYRHKKEVEVRQKEKENETKRLPASTLER